MAPRHRDVKRSHVLVQEIQDAAEKMRAAILTGDSTLLETSQERLDAATAELSSLIPFSIDAIRKRIAEYAENRHSATSLAGELAILLRDEE